MHLVLKTVLNHVEQLKGFVYESSELISGPPGRIEIRVRARERSRGACSHCQQPAAGYDRLPERRFQFVPLWGIATYFRYAPRRVRCPEHGICVEHLPWALGKRPLTASFAWFLASWAKLLSWQEVSRTFKTSWESVYRSVEMAVDWGRARMDLSGITALGVDEIHWRKGKFLTLVYQINEGMKRLLFVAENREETSLRKFFLWFGAPRTALIRFICSDMWQPYLNVIAERAGEGDARDPRPQPPERQAGHPHPFALVSAEASREPDRSPIDQAQRVAAVQSSHHSRLPAQGGIPALLGIRLAGLGGEIHESVVHEGAALAFGADAKDRAHAARSSVSHSQLVRGARTGVPRCRRGSEQPPESESQKVLRLSNLRSDQNHALS
jgi:hypothetical protein